MQKNKKILTLCLLTLLLGITLSSSITYIITKNLRQDYNHRMMILGMWQSQTNGERLILIRVENRDIDEIIKTARHEIAHEIYFRHPVSGINDEDFAKNCENNFDECVEEYYSDGGT